MRYMGIDYGTKKTGIALSDESGTLAFPHTILSTNAHLIDAIYTIAEEEEVAVCVVGRASDQTGAENPVMESINEFCDQLQKRGTIEVVLQDEGMTSAHARHALDEKPTARKRKQAKQVVDAQAAALILQRYLDSH